MNSDDPAEQRPAPLTDGPDADEQCAAAMRWQFAGDWERAEDGYRRILAGEPGHAAANYCLGMLKVQQREPALALPHLLQALQTQPEESNYWLGCVETLLLLGRPEEATSTLALARQRGLEGPAVQELAARLAARAASAQGAVIPAAPRAQPPGEMPDMAAAEARLMTLLERGQVPEARALAATLVRRFPSSGLAWKAHGSLLWSVERVEEAAAAMRQCVRLLPEDVEGLSHLGLIELKLKHLATAEELLRKAIAIAPRQAMAYYRLGMVLEARGASREAQSVLRAAIALDERCDTADARAGQSELLFLLSRDPEVDHLALCREHFAVGERFERPARNRRPPHRNERRAERALRVGLVSGDLWNHAVSHFLEPVLRVLAHAPLLELTAYHTHSREDEVTGRLRGLVKHWRNSGELSSSDEQLAQTVMRDGIDILIDLSGHTGFNRLGMFALKPAPVQVSWLGYVGTTGLRAMDYYLTDRHYLPAAQFAAQFTEKLVYLPAMAPFQPVVDAPPVNPLPALQAAAICFASFHNANKINRPTITLWAALLRAVPTATLRLAAMPSGARREEIAAEFCAQGVERGRLEFHEPCAMHAYLRLHHQVDLCLDAQPWSGGTTTNHAFWMGVPTLTRVGLTPASRLTAALSQQVGLEAFIAHSDEEFIAKGRYWAAHAEQLAALRRELRERCARAPARQPALIAAALERALRIMWRRWCAGLAPESFAVDELAGAAARTGDSPGRGGAPGAGGAPAPPVTGI